MTGRSTEGSSVESWRSTLVEHVDGLSRWFQGRVVRAAGPSDEVVPASRFLDPDYLHDAIARASSILLHADDAGGSAGPRSSAPGVDTLAEDKETLSLRVAVSRFARHYSAALTGAALTSLAHGVGLDLAARHCRMVVRHDLVWQLELDSVPGEIVLCAERPTSWPVLGDTTYVDAPESVDTLDELRARVWHSLYAEHLWPMFAAAIEVTKVGPDLLWSNAAEWVGLVSESATEYLGPREAERFVSEREALMQAPALPGVPFDTNPLLGLVHWVDGEHGGEPIEVMTRHLCCLNYLLADRFGRLCQSCPYLPLPDRVELARERHGVPMGAPGGEAEKRAIEHGLGRPSARRIAARSAPDEPRPAEHRGDASVTG